jgi:hypothetical protein
MKIGNYIYQVKFSDGRVIRREYLTEEMARSMYTSMINEMSLCRKLYFDVISVAWGKM